MKKVICTLMACFIISVGTISICAENVCFIGRVKVDYLNIRQGASLKHKVIGSLNKGDIIDVISQIDSWYIIKTKDDIVGACMSDYIENIDDKKLKIELLSEINQYRKKDNIKELIIDEKLSEIASLKAKDMAENKYFLHESKKYGKINKMLEDSNYSYITIGENLTKAKNAEEIIELYMNSDVLKENILSNSYNYTGIGYELLENDIYVVVQVFVGRYEK